VKKDVASFLRREFSMLPWFIAAPMLAMQLLFLAGAALAPQNFAQRWERLGLPFQALLRLYRSLILLAFLEHPRVRSAMGLKAPPQERMA
ncbi:MAG TPA: hypothetical protein VHB73_05795, partial [Alphaproteobacteria bacterium]|nr:hypothetical protein [Alphaproteobacteria bacterium]